MTPYPWFRRPRPESEPRRRPAPRRPSYRAQIEVLECRLAPAVFTVRNTADAGGGSLRQAILDAEQTSGSATIVFAAGVTGVIDLTTPLPDLTGSIDLEGPSPAGITVRRSQVPATPAFRIFSVAAGATVTLAQLNVTDGSFPGDVFVGDRPGSGSAGITRVDPITGAQTLLAAQAATQFEELFGIALESAGTLVGAESGPLPGGVIRVDPTTGAVTPVSLNGNFSSPDGIAPDATGVLFVADASAGILRVDPVTGAQTVVSPLGPGFNPLGLALDTAGTIFVTNGSSFAQGVLRIDPATGARTPVSLGGSFAAPAGIAVAPDGEVFVADRSAFGGTGGILRVDPATGAQTQVASGGFLVHPSGIALDTTGSLLVADADALGGTGAVAPDAPAIRGWGEFLEGGQRTPSDLAAAVLNSLESDLDQVQRLYQHLLGRAADPTGLGSFTSALQHGATSEVAALLILGSTEYFQNA